MAKRKKMTRQPAWQIMPPSKRILASLTFDTKREAWKYLKDAYFISPVTAKQAGRFGWSVVPCEIVIRPKPTKRK